MMMPYISLQVPIDFEFKKKWRTANPIKHNSGDVKAVSYGDSYIHV